MTNEELVIQYQNGCVEALDQLYDQTKGLVKFFANKYVKSAGTILSFEDLEQIAWIKLIEVAKSYSPNDDPDGKSEFASYVGKAINYAMINATYLSHNRTHKRHDRGEYVNVNSMSEVIPGTDSVTYGESIADETSDFLHPDNPYLKIEEELYLEELRDDLFSLLDQVLDNDFSATLIVEYYGLNCDPINQYELADKYNVGKSRIQHLISEGIRTIRRSDEGRSFMRKYQVEYTEMVIQKKESFNEFQSPDKLIMKMEIIDDLLDNIMSKCGVSEE